MSPVQVTQVHAGGEGMMNPFVGDVDHTAPVRVNVTALTTAEVDANGYLKPGVPLAKNGVLVGAGVAVYGVTLEAIKVAKSNSATDLAAASNAHPVAIGTIGQVNRAIMESNLGRVLTADEIAGFGLAGSHIVLVS